MGRPYKKTKHAHVSSFQEVHHPEKPSAFNFATDASTSTSAQQRRRRGTVSIALPGSIVDNAQSAELRASLAGQIARTLAIFSVDEVIVYDCLGLPAAAPQGFTRGKYRGSNAPGPSDELKELKGTPLLAKLLEYLETPQYLRRHIFPLHPSLRFAGLLPPLDMPHHLRRTDIFPFREGVVMGATAEGAEIEIGLDEKVWIEQPGAHVKEGMRVTVRMAAGTQKASLCSPRQPITEASTYWGYSLRTSESLSGVLEAVPPAFGGKNGYDLVVGTSERGVSLDTALRSTAGGEEPRWPEQGFEHLLIVFGPLSGLELTVGSDPNIPLEAEEASDLFDLWLNVCEGQGSRTVRTEEALVITLARLKSKVDVN